MTWYELGILAQSVAAYWLAIVLVGSLVAWFVISWHRDRRPAKRHTTSAGNPTRKRSYHA